MYFNTETQKFVVEPEDCCVYVPNGLYAVVRSLNAYGDGGTIIMPLRNMLNDKREITEDTLLTVIFVLSDEAVPLVELTKTCNTVGYKIITPFDNPKILETYVREAVTFVGLFTENYAPKNFYVCYTDISKVKAPNIQEVVEQPEYLLRFGTEIKDDNEFGVIGVASDAFSDYGGMTDNSITFEVRSEKDKETIIGILEAMVHEHLLGQFSVYTIGENGVYNYICEATNLINNPEIILYTRFNNCSEFYHIVEMCKN